MGKIVIMDHPLVQHKIGIIRRKETGTKDCRDNISEIAMLMCYEATRDLELDDVEIFGTEYINKCYVINQQPIGRAKTSNIATYTGVFDVIRKLFAQTQDAKDFGFDMSFFSLNAEGGCPTCKGQGFLVYNVGFGDINMICDRCHGTGYIDS